jgi:MFS family permease
MLFRFSLYGFLKNQRYFEPFLVLAFLDKGLSYTMIGTLYGFREICINVMEIPTGAIADVVGRRRSMILSFTAYIAAFLVFGFCTPLWALFIAMFLFSVGEAFRTGTHKAIIFDWLAREGREGEKTRIYGFTRSWSKIGSALNAILAAIIVFTTRNYSLVFVVCVIPYLANILNFMGYPSYLDGSRTSGPGLGEIARTLWRSLRDSLRSKPLRRLMVESMGFEGVYQAIKDYLQPMLLAAAVALAGSSLAGWIGELDEIRRTAILVALAFTPLHLLSAYASRHAHVLADRAGSEQRGAVWVWAMDLLVFGVMALAMFMGWSPVAIVAFIALAMLQNFWRPMLISRFSEYANPEQTATVLSIESQAKSMAAAVLAPAIGWAIDRMPDVGGGGDGTGRFLPVAIVGICVASIMLATSPRKQAARAA